MKLFTVKGRDLLAVLFGAYTHLVKDNALFADGRETYCGITLMTESKIGVAEEFDCPACARELRG